jgi:hypothetical protein
MNKHPKTLADFESTKESKSQLLHSATDSNPPKFTATHPTTQILASQNRFHREAVCFVFRISLRTKIHGCFRHHRSGSKSTSTRADVFGTMSRCEGSWSIGIYNTSTNTCVMIYIYGVVHGYLIMTWTSICSVSDVGFRVVVWFRVFVCFRV